MDRCFLLSGPGPAHVPWQFTNNASRRSTERHRSVTMGCRGSLHTFCTVWTKRPAGQTVRAVHPGLLLHRHHPRHWPLGKPFEH